MYWLRQLVFEQNSERLLKFFMRTRTYEKSSAGKHRYWIYI